MFMKRPGGQSQYSVPLSLQACDDAIFAELHAWMATHLDEDLRVERLAERVSMSARRSRVSMRRRPAARRLARSR